jgi:hypothetical protein
MHLGFPGSGSVSTTLSLGITRETRVEWPLLSVETEVNGDSKSTYERVLPWQLCLSCRYTRDFCSALAALVSTVQNIFFLSEHYFNYLVLIAQQARPAAVLGRLSLGMCLWKSHLFFMYQYKKISKKVLRAGHKTFINGLGAHSKNVRLSTV